MNILPVEMIEHILQFCESADIQRFLMTCSEYRNMGNDRFWARTHGKILRSYTDFDKLLLGFGKQISIAMEIAGPINSNTKFKVVRSPITRTNYIIIYHICTGYCVGLFDFNFIHALGNLDIECRQIYNHDPYLYVKKRDGSYEIKKVMMNLESAGWCKCVVHKNYINKDYRMCNLNIINHNTHEV